MKIEKILDVEKDKYPYCPQHTLITASPGCGKTYAALNQFLIPAINLKIDPSKILSCSFTKAAARELRERLSKSTGTSVDKLKPVCSTIHSEALKRFRNQFFGQRFEIIGMPKYATDEDDAIEGPNSRVEEAFAGLADYDIKKAKALRVWDLARNNLITDYTCNAFNKIAQSILGPYFDQRDIRGWIEEYELSKKKEKLLDFTDILIKALQCPAPQRELLIVDEFQDSTDLQIKLIEKWASTSKYTICILDPDQCIFSFSGAKPDSIFDLITKGYETRRLAKSFRVPKIPHKYARQLILKNSNRVDSPYEPTDKEGSIQILTQQEAISEISSEILDDDKDVFVLARTSRILESWANYLTEEGIQFINERGMSPWGSPISLSIARAVMAIRENQTISYEDTKRLIDSLPGKDNKEEYIYKYDYLTKGTVKKKIIDSLCSTFKLSFTAKDLEDYGITLVKIKEAQLEVVFNALGLGERAYSIARVISRSGSDALYNTPRIRLTTMHTSKGREADLVVVDLELNNYGISECQKNPKAIESERRLLYVAMTRTKDSLVLVRDGADTDLGTITGLSQIPTYEF